MGGQTFLSVFLEKADSCLTEKIETLSGFLSLSGESRDLLGHGSFFSPDKLTLSE